MQAYIRRTDSGELSLGAKNVSTSQGKELEEQVNKSCKSRKPEATLEDMGKLCTFTLERMTAQSLHH